MSLLCGRTLPGVIHHPTIKHRHDYPGILNRLWVQPVDIPVQGYEIGLFARKNAAKPVIGTTEPGGATVSPWTTLR